jgi:hypothetical protein
VESKKFKVTSEEGKTSMLMASDVALLHEDSEQS